MSPLTTFDFDWDDLAFASKKPLTSLRAIFIAAPRSLSKRRIVQLIKTYLPAGNILWGIAKEPHIAGFEGQPQFTTLQAAELQDTATKVNKASPNHRIFTLSYHQRDLTALLPKIGCKQAIFVNGSWARSFHLRAEYYTLVNQAIPFQLISPFADEAEAMTYAAITPLISPPANDTLTAPEMLAAAATAAKQSYDTSHQTGVSLGRPIGDGRYELVLTSFNKVVPYQSYALHHGASREKHFSPPHDLNHYDTVHAEVMAIMSAQKQNIDLRGTTLFINLLPCPGCARMFTQTDIAEFVYAADHSDGYAIHMLEAAGKKVTRIVNRD